MNDKRINNADLFSQPPLVIFTKGANISGGHYIYIYIYIYIHKHKITLHIKCKLYKIVFF